MEIRVRNGDSLWYYSRLFGVPEKLIMDSNPGIADDELGISKTIRIPGYRKVPYTLLAGDTLWNISTYSGIPEDMLFLLNEERTVTHFSVGETIYLPIKETGTPNRRKTFYDSRQLDLDIIYLQNIYPFLRFQVIGKSVLGKPIHEIRIGHGPRKIHMNASFHANEWITSLILMDFIEFYLLSLTNGTELAGTTALALYEQVELSIVPMVNPDGVDLVLNGPPQDQRKNLIELNGGNDEFVHWKANIRGVDLNNQFPANWEVEKIRKQPKAPAARDYPGDSPLTEPEAIALANLAHQNAFSCIVALHTQGKEFYWGYEGLEPPQSEEIAKEFERKSGYKAVRYVDSHAGYKDWFIQEFRRPGFTVELGKGINPLPLSMVDEIIHEVRGLFISLLSYHLK
ncbi:MAG: M14 family metallopeptidase [Bacillota bacterium]|nr:M14 family metallopeptidase [Bacillota bacterium]